MRPRLFTDKPLVGPMEAATKTRRGAMLCGNSENTTKCLGIRISNGVSLIVFPEKEMKGYSIYAKHRESNRVFAVSSWYSSFDSSSTIYYCENEKWAGQAGIPSQPFDGAFTAPTGQECGGSPVSTWQAWRTL